MRVPLSIRLDPSLFAWVEERVGPGREFKDYTHALERGIVALQEREGTPSRPSRTSTSKK